MESDETTISRQYAAELGQERFHKLCANLRAAAEERTGRTHYWHAPLNRDVFELVPVGVD